MKRNGESQIKCKELKDKWVMCSVRLEKLKWEHLLDY
jgi:hypothetical protein